MKRVTVLTLINIAVLMLVLAPVFVIADTPGPCKPGELCNPLKNISSLEGFVVAALKVVRDIAFLVAIFFIVYAGYMFVTAQGSDDKLKTAKNAFLWAIVGTAVILGAEIFARILQGTVTQIGG